MNTIITNTKYGPEITNDDKILSSLLCSITRNNTFCPNIKRRIFSLSKNVDGQYTLATTLFFVDGTKTTVKNFGLDFVSVIVKEVELSDGSKIEVETATDESKEIGIAYAILKRIVCTPDENGIIKGSGFINFIRKNVEKAWDQNVEDAKIKAEANIKKACLTKESKNRTNKKDDKKPSLRECVSRLANILSAYENKSK